MKIKIEKIKKMLNKQLNKIPAKIHFQVMIFLNKNIKK